MKIHHPGPQLIFAITAVLLAASCSNDEVEFTGTLDHRPEGKGGMWVIDGKSFSVTDDVELDEEEGALSVGACVGLEMEDGDVTEIESMKLEECQKEK